MFCFGGFGFGFPPGPFGFLKHDQQYKEGYQRQDKKYRPALAVNGRIDHLGPQVNAKFANGENPEAVPENAQRNHRQYKHSPLPGCAQKNIAGQQTGDEQHQAGMDAAAFRGDLNGDSRQLKHQTILKKRRARQLEKSPGNYGGAVLQKNVNPPHQKRGDGQHENQEA